MFDANLVKEMLQRNKAMLKHRIKHTRFHPISEFGESVIANVLQDSDAPNIMPQV